jgi:hypothetical protein
LKWGSRVLINTSPEPVTNWTASIVEDIAVVIGLWGALNHPILFIAALILFILLMIWLLPKLWTGIKTIFSALGRFFSGTKEEDSANVNLDYNKNTIEQPVLKMNYKDKK